MPVRNLGMGEFMRCLRKKSWVAAAFGILASAGAAGWCGLPQDYQSAVSRTRQMKHERLAQWSDQIIAVYDKTDRYYQEISGQEAAGSLFGARETTIAESLGLLLVDRETAMRSPAGLISGGMLHEAKRISQRLKKRQYSSRSLQNVEFALEMAKKHLFCLEKKIRTEARTDNGEQVQIRWTASQTLQAILRDIDEVLAQAPRFALSGNVEVF